MFSWQEFHRTKNVLSEAGSGSYQESHGQHHLYLRPKDLLRWVEFLCDDLGYLSLLDLTCVDHGTTASERFELIYHLQNMGSHQRTNLHVRFNDGETIPSIRRLYSHADWLEREQGEMFHLRFGEETQTLLLPPGQKNFPLRKDAVIRSWPVAESLPFPELRKNPNKSESPYPEENWVWKRYSFATDETRGNFEWMVCFDPGKVVRSRVDIGYHHQGLEKRFERMDWLQILHYVHRIHEGAAPHYSIGWVKTLEDVLGVRIPERSQAIRIIMLELSRIAEHLTVLHEITMALGLDEHRHFIDLREKVYELFEKYSGHRQGYGVAWLGGTKVDLPHGWIVEYQSVAAALLKLLPLVNNVLISKKSFRNSLGGETTSAQTILEWGVTGPAMRAAGVNFDLRKSQPFYFYRDIDFDIPVGIFGRAYDRYLIRLEEIFQSLRIVTQVIDNLPLGAVVSEEFALPTPELLQKLNARGAPESWHSSAIETPNGEGGFSLLLEKDWKPRRVRIKTPGLLLAQAVPVLTLGLREDELAASVASLGIRRGEVDR